jgi:hypothetical protein
MLKSFPQAAIFHKFFNMHHNIITFFLSTSLVGFARAASGADAIVAGIKNVTNDIVTINSTLNTFNGSLIGTLTALQIQGQAQDLLSGIESTTATANATSVLGQADSITVTNSVTGLQPFVYSLIDNFVARHQAFETAVLGVASATSLVESDLTNIKNATDALGNAIISKLVPEIQKLAPLVTSEIDFHFQRALQVYSS